MRRYGGGIRHEPISVPAERFHSPFDAFERASDAVARGNPRVFEEIGLQFAGYLHDCPPDAPAEAPEVERFLAGLRPGEPPERQQASDSLP